MLTKQWKKELYSSGKAEYLAYIATEYLGEQCIEF